MPVTVAFLLASCTTTEKEVRLDGEWRLADGPSLTLPGTLDDAGIGDTCKLQAVMSRETLRHPSRRHSYVGPMTYEREVEIPRRLAGKPLQVIFERVIWKSSLAIDGIDTGQTQESLVAPHVFNLDKGLSAGRHTLQLTIDNSKQYDISFEEMCHAYTDETQIKWNGVLGEMKLRETPAISEVQIYPDAGCHSIVVVLDGSNVSQPIFAVDGRTAAATSIDERTYRIDLGTDARLWDEFDPTLHELTVECGDQSASRSFGLRTLSGEGGVLRVNGRRTFLRGALECCIFPLSGTPPATEEGWLKVFRTARDWGLNHLRFHSYCPPDAAFRVADKMGFYLQVELPVWSLNVGKDEAVCEFMRREFMRISRYYGNHPSLCLVSCGNELQPDFHFLNTLVRFMKGYDPRRLYTTATFTFEEGHGSAPEPEDQFFVTQWTASGWVRGQGVFDSEPPSFDKNYQTAIDRPRVPFISHEIGQYAVYPNLREIDKYTGVLDPLNLKAIRRDLNDKGMLAKADDFVHASGRLAVILYKEEIERALKTERQSGFQLLGLQDFPGQSTATVGLVDAFWDAKPFVSSEEFRQFCAPVVPLLSFPKAVYVRGEPFKADVLVANYGRDDLLGKDVNWQVSADDGSVLFRGSLHPSELGQGGVATAGSISFPTDTVAAPCRLTIGVEIDGTDWHNEWHVWLYPDQDQPACDNCLTTDNIDKAIEALSHGADVLLSPPLSAMTGLEGKFVPVFWSPVHFPEQAGTMGILCDSHHPAFASFPNEGHSDWQWWQLVKNAKVLDIGSLPQKMDPLIAVVDNFARNRRLALAVEARVGKGRLILTSMDLLGKQATLPEARSLLASLIRYLDSDRCTPSVALTEAELRSLVK